MTATNMTASEERAWVALGRAGKLSLVLGLSLVDYHAELRREALRLDREVTNAA